MKKSYLDSLKRFEWVKNCTSQLALSNLKRFLFTNTLWNRQHPEVEEN